MIFYRILGVLIGPFRVGGFNLINRLLHVPRARVLVWNENDELLLVRNWGGKRQWGLPGGGVHRNEEYIAAAKRELYEELGLDLSIEKFFYVATLQYQYEALIYSVIIAKDALPARPHNPREITHLRWFSVSELPADVSPLVSLALKNLSKKD